MKGGLFLLGLLWLSTAASGHLVIDPSTTRGPWTSPKLAEWRNELERQARREAGQSATQNRLVGNSLLTSSRESLARIVTLSAFLEMRPDPEVEQALIREADALAAWSSWEQGEFLAVGDAMAGLSIALSTRSPEDQSRDEWARALIEKGIRPTLSAVTQRVDWSKRNNNWPQVIGSSLVLGSLAIEEVSPELSNRAMTVGQELLARSSASYQQALLPEGVDYWNYGVDFQALANRALTLQQKSGVFPRSTWENAGAASLFAISPTGRAFNFGDSAEDFVPSVGLLEIARVLQKPEWVQRWLYRFDPSSGHWRESRRLWGLAGFWAHQTSPLSGTPRVPKVWLPHDTSSFGVIQEGSVWLAFRSGRNGAPHSHLDLGSFVLEIGGERWAIDLGSDDYSLPGYFDAKQSGQRWTYTRNIESSHNVVTFEKWRQSVSGRAVPTRVSEDPPKVRLDLSGAVMAPPKAHFREFLILEANAARVTDEIDMSGRGHWNLITRADVTQNGRDLVLAQNGKRLRVSVTGKVPRQWDLAPLNTKHLGEKPLQGVTRARLSIPPGRQTITVDFTLIDK